MSATDAAPLAGWRAGLAYGGLGLPLAFVALPLHVQLPDHYGRQLGVPLAALGLLLLAARAVDAVLDPAIGRALDRLLDRGRTRPVLGVAAGAGLALALGFHALFFPPVQGVPALLAWCAGSLALAYLGASTLTVLHQAWGARLGGSAPERARVVAWREGCALLGVLLASLLPLWLGLEGASAALALALVLGGLGLARAPAPQPLAGDPHAPPASPWRVPGFAPLLGLYALNGLASAIPATLVLFFVRDRLGLPEASGAFLALYFAAAALSLPAWVRAAGRWGLARSWAAGMGLALLSFVGAALLAPGQGLAFGLICAASGAALGADLSAPPALLAGLLQRQPRGTRQAGACFGWWQFTTKGVLALAAGLALPLLAGLGYDPGQPTAAGVAALQAVYALLPCLLKLLALALCWRLLCSRKEPE